MKLEEILRPYKVISIIGLAKNVGKTTVLNHIMSKDATKTALTSIGRDGEDLDLVTHKEKPRVFVSSGAIIITAEGLLKMSQIRTKILQRTGWASAMGEILIAQALSSGRVQIGGPSMAKQLEELVTKLEEYDLDKIYIDGALGRKSLARPTIADACILCTGAAIYADLQGVVELTRFNVQILTLPKANENEDVLYISGAVSNERINQLIMSGKKLTGKTIVADDPSKFFITADTYNKIQIKEAKLAVINPINLVAVTINPTSPRDDAFDPVNFFNLMSEAIDVPVFDVVRNH